MDLLHSIEQELRLVGLSEKKRTRRTTRRRLIADVWKAVGERDPPRNRDDCVCFPIGVRTATHTSAVLHSKEISLSSQR